MDSQNNHRRFGVGPVFFTAISTILGAILFLRFGFAVGTLGFLGVVLIILLGHLVTIPTALAISELATNKRVEGGGEYFIISRSFGLNIGGTIGIALFFSQAISVAFYVIAFTEAFEAVFNWASNSLSINLPRQVISIPAMIALSFLILKKGAGLGVRALYFVVVILAISLLLFFLGKPTAEATAGFNFSQIEFRNSKDFFMVFAIIFPAFTGMTAGVGLSGDLKNPARSIPLGTIVATISGMIIYFFIIYKLAASASPDELTSEQLIMGKIAIGGAIIIPFGLAASTISSALGSVMVAPRTLQALAVDHTFPSKRLNQFLKKGKGIDNEPVNASWVTCTIALLFVALGNVNAVAEIISMFFMVTYGSLCLISFLNHFGASPSYRPSFRSKWYFSLTGFLASIWIMFKINPLYALIALVTMVMIYLFINSYHKKRQGMSGIFSNALYQLNRNLQVYLQKKRKRQEEVEWRPSALCISGDSFERDEAFKVLNWISYKYGFGTYIHKITGYFSHESDKLARTDLEKLRDHFDEEKNHVFIDTLISPSYTSAIAQTIQTPGISGMENNLILLEFDQLNPVNLDSIITNLAMVHAGAFDIGIIGSSPKEKKKKCEIHVWIGKADFENANLMILLSFIILGHPDWRKSKIRIFQVFKDDNYEDLRMKHQELLIAGRLPITAKSIEWVREQENISFRNMVMKRSAEAGLCLMGFHLDQVKHEGRKVFEGYENMGTLLFVNSHRQINIV